MPPTPFNNIFAKKIADTIVKWLSQYLDKGKYASRSYSRLLLLPLFQMFFKLRKYW